MSGDERPLDIGSTSVMAARSRSAKSSATTVKAGQGPDRSPDRQPLIDPQGTTEYLGGGQERWWSSEPSDFERLPTTEGAVIELLVQVWRALSC